MRTIIKDAPFLTGHGFDSHGGYVIMCIEKSIGADRYQWLTLMLFSVSVKTATALFVSMSRRNFDRSGLCDLLGVFFFASDSANRS